MANDFLPYVVKWCVNIFWSHLFDKVLIFKKKTYPKAATTLNVCWLIEWVCRNDSHSLFSAKNSIQFSNNNKAFLQTYKMKQTMNFRILFSFMLFWFTLVTLWSIQTNMRNVFSKKSKQSSFLFNHFYEMTI